MTRDLILAYVIVAATGLFLYWVMVTVHNRSLRRGRQYGKQPPPSRFPQWKPGHMVYLYRLEPAIAASGWNNHYLHKSEKGLTDAEILQAFGPGRYYAVLVFRPTSTELPGRPVWREVFTLTEEDRTA